MLIDLSRNQGAAVLFISHDIALTGIFPIILR